MSDFGEVDQEKDKKWLAFHYAYDSAMRAYRRGTDVSRAVNWLYVMSREKVTPEEREMERENREYGLKIGAEAKDETEIGRKVWAAIESGELCIEPPKVVTFGEGNQK